MTFAFLNTQHYYSLTALLNITMVAPPPSVSSDHQDGGSMGKEEEVPMGDEELDVIRMERKQINEDVLVLVLPLLLPKQK